MGEFVEGKELKVDQSPDAALTQIKEKQYALRFYGKLGEMPYYTGRIVAVGISYDRETKQHSCKVELVRDVIKSERKNG